MSNGAKTRAKQILRNLREDIVKKAIQWTARRFYSVSEAEVLLAILCEYEENSNNCGIQEESGAASEEQMRNLWRTIEIARSPYRRKYKKQYAREYSNALRTLSHQAPSLYPEAWANGCWESDIKRVSNGVKNRVDRLKCLGNAVVPQQFFPIFAAIAEIEEGQDE